MQATRQISVPLPSEIELRNMLTNTRHYANFINPYMDPRLKAFVETVFLAGLAQGSTNKQIELSIFIP
jgi:hypothetical protein